MHAPHFIASSPGAPSSPPPPLPAPCEVAGLFLRFFSSNALPLQWWPKSKAGAQLRRPFLRRFFSPVVVLWYLVFQRLNADKSLEAVVADARQGGADSLLKAVAKEKRTKRLPRLKSRSTSAYSQARSALPVEVLRRACAFLGEEIARLLARARKLEETSCALRIVLLDGSTIAMRPFGDIAKVFGGPTNQHKRAYWCMMRVAACFCLRTGALVSAACAPYATSEVELSWRLMAETARSALFVGDRGFGVYSVAERAAAFGHDVILRLEECRARRLLGKSSMKKGEEAFLNWEPTRHDHPAPESKRAPVAGRLLRVRLELKGYRPLTLWLFTTLVDQDAWPLARLAACYGLRWNAEVDLRHLKAGLGMERLEAQSSAMACREFYAGILSYNLVRLLMHEAAIRARVSIMELSFRSCQRVIERAFMKWMEEGVWLDAGRFSRRMEALLKELGKCRLPRRRKPRPSEPRKLCPMHRAFPAMTRSRSEERARISAAPQPTS